MTSDAEREDLGSDPSTWPIDQLHTLIQNVRGQRLETVRIVAQEHAYDSARPRAARRQWAKLSLHANRLMLAAGEGNLTRVTQHDFMLRTWVIDNLGPDDTDPDWNPDALAADTLHALTITPAQAAALADEWRDLATEQIRQLRRHKNLTAHLDTLLGHLPPGRTRDQLCPGPPPAGCFHDRPARTRRTPAGGVLMEVDCADLPLEPLRQKHADTARSAPVQPEVPLGASTAVRSPALTREEDHPGHQAYGSECPN
ncbi:hypothetical protein GCM10010329_62790 [Streptomyces spiroverticillatus]|nr:hypothetical protein GCM10010329_62790 [Streptomyces spiroverticillatus]